MADTTPIGATVLGYPRIGPHRELKKALENYWSGQAGEADLRAVAAQLRQQTWTQLQEAGLDSVPGNTFSFYDQVLDTAVMVDAVPSRFRDLGLSPLDTYFAMARGTDGVPPLEMTKWFDTNYHYLVPELAPDTRFQLVANQPLADYQEALGHGVTTRPVLVGPVTFLLLAKASAQAPAGFAALSLLDDLLDVYLRVLAELADAGVQWVQLDEPALVGDRTPAELDAVRRAYERLGAESNRPKLFVPTYFGRLGEALPVLASTPVEAIGIDLVTHPQALTEAAAHYRLRTKVLVAGLVDGRNVWRTDLRLALTTAARLLGSVGSLAVATSCPLLHVPYDLDAPKPTSSRTYGGGFALPVRKLMRWWC